MPCWAVALLVWAFRLVSGRACVGEFSRRVLRAPVDLPRRTTYAICRFRRRMGDTELRRISRTAMRELVAALKKEGFAVVEKAVTEKDFVHVRAIVPEHREDEYREVVERVYRQCAVDISLERFYAATEPVDLLDERWARNYGKQDHARAAHTAPCNVCGRRQKVREVFGSQEVFRIFNESRNAAEVYVARDGRRYIGTGHFCQACREREGLVVITGIAITDHEPDEEER